jgi:hypothetical protein
MSTTTDTHARVARKLRGRPASDGAGVKLTRVIGSPELDMLDPFLLLDEFGTDKAEDYLAAFPIIRIVASRPSRTCSTGACAIATTTATKGCSCPAACSG